MKRHGGTLENIQVLRFVAALMVMAYHFSWYLDDYFSTKTIINTSSGVVLFFCISGFVLWNNLNYEEMSGFLKNRVNRIYPSLYLAFIAAFIIRFALFSEHDILYVFFYFKTLELLPLGPSYYPLGVEWTLIYEVYFYIVLGVLCLVNKKIRRIFPALWLLFLIISYLFLNKILFSSVEQMLFDPRYKIIFSSCGIPFVMGILGRQFLNKYKLTRNGRISIFAVAAVGSVAANFYREGMFKVLTYSDFDLIFAVLYSLLIISVAEVKSENRVMKMLKTAGDYSYGVYLMHVIIITSFFDLHKKYMGSDLNYGLVSLMFVLTVAIALMFGYLEHYLYILRKRSRK